MCHHQRHSKLKYFYIFNTIPVLFFFILVQASIFLFPFPVLLFFSGSCDNCVFFTLCVFAECYVFNKQLQRPGFCGCRQLRKRVPSPTTAYLLPKLRYHFAQFLQQSSLKRLGLLDLTTCVGFGYDSCVTEAQRLFLEAWHQPLRYTSTACYQISAQSTPDLPKIHAYILSPGQPTPG